MLLGMVTDWFGGVCVNVCAESSLYNLMQKYTKVNPKLYAKLA